MDFAKPEPHKTISRAPASSKPAHSPAKAPTPLHLTSKPAHVASKPSQPTSQTLHHATKAESVGKKSKKSKKNQNLVFIACGILAVLAVALISWAVISMMNKGTISEDTTFATNDTQTTITIEPTDGSSSTSHTRTVYEYDSNNNVTSMKTYFEYADNAAAKTAYELIKDQPEFKGAEVIDKYIVVAADPNSFKGLTADDIRQQSENLKRYYEGQKKTEPTEPAPSDQPEAQPEPEEHPEDHPDEG